jgi:IclR family transcriptional regulator, KDG regulon repressor
VPAPTAAPLVTEDGQGLRSVSIAVSVLDCFAAHRELGATQLARELGVAKSTACRMLSALATGGLLERAAGGRYRLSLRVFELGLLAAERMPVRDVARPVLIDLQEQLREMVQLGVPVAGHVAYIDRYGNTGLGFQLSGEVLRRVPGYSSSSGRVLAAFDEDIMAETLAVPRRKHTPFTITDTERLGRVLATARTAGWIGTRDEFTRGYSSVAAPVLVPAPGGGMRPVAAISVVGPTGRILDLRKDFIAACVCRAARRVGALLAQAAED